MQSVKIGDGVTFYNEFGKPRQALVTAVHGEVVYSGNGDLIQVPCVNLVFVSDDEARHDNYGRQIERTSSVVHKSSQPAHGMYWDWPE